MNNPERSMSSLARELEILQWLDARPVPGSDLVKGMSRYEVANTTSNRTWTIDVPCNDPYALSVLRDNPYFEITIVSEAPMEPNGIFNVGLPLGAGNPILTDSILQALSPGETGLAVNYASWGTRQLKPSWTLTTATAGDHSAIITAGPDGKVVESQPLDGSVSDHTLAIMKAIGDLYPLTLREDAAIDTAFARLPEHRFDAATSDIVARIGKFRKGQGSCPFEIQELRNVLDLLFARTVTDATKPEHDFYSDETLAEMSRYFHGLPVEITNPAYGAETISGLLTQVIRGSGPLDPAFRISICTAHNVHNLVPGHKFWLDMTVQSVSKYAEPVMFGKLLDSLVHSLKTLTDPVPFFESFKGVQVAIPFSVRRKHGRYIPANSVALFKKAEIVLARKHKSLMISLDTPYGAFTHNHRLIEANRPHKAKDSTVHSFTLSQKADITRDYKNGTGMTKIGRQFGVSKETIKSLLVNAGVTLRGRGRPVNIIAAYKKGAGIDTLSARTGIAAGRIKKALSASGAKLRGPGRPIDMAKAYANGASIADLAQRTGTTYTIVRNQLLKNGVTLRAPGRPVSK